MILFTGDNPPHNVWMSNSEEIFNITSKFVELLYGKYNYTGPVFPALGNHEEFTADQYNPIEGIREVEFLKSMGDIFKMWLNKSEMEMFLKNGYYTTKYLNTNLRIISLNCFMCDVMNFFLVRNPTDPGLQFLWLEKTLRAAENDNEYVYIIGHIPPGDSTYLSECSKRYNALVDRFSHIIQGQFYGHTHNDEFRIISEYFNKTNPIGLILTAPSLTTYSFQKPSFRYYEIDPSENFLLENYHQYRLNITEANLLPRGVKPKWTNVYNATTLFNVKNLNDYNGFKIITEKMLNDTNVFSAVIDAFFAQGIDKKDYIGDNRLANFISCRFKIDVFDDYLKCTNYRTWDTTEYLNRFIEMFSGKWYEKIHDQEFLYGHENSNQ